jgi:sodium/pantothenate symporter
MNGLASDQLVMASWVSLSLYAALILFFVIRGALKIRSISDYAVGNMLFSPVAVGLSLAASMTSAATFIINPGFVAYYGISGVLSMAIALPLGACLSLVVLTKSFRKFGISVKSLTMAKWMGERYQSAGYSLFFALLSLLLITFIVLICVGLTKVISQSLNLPEFPVLTGIVVFVFGYMMFGGANAMVYTNMVQALLMLVVAVILLTSGYAHFSAGIEGFLATLTAIDPGLTQPFNQESFLFRDAFEVIFCQFIVGIAVVCQPHIITRSLLLNSDKDVNKYLVTGVVVEILFFMVVFTGLYARLSFPDLTVNGAPLALDNVLSVYVVKEFPVYVGLIVVLGLISAGLSTLEGLVQSLSTTLTSDVLRPIAGNWLMRSPQNPGGLLSEVWVNRAVIVVLAVVAIQVSWQQLVSPDLSVGIFAQNGVYAYFSAAFVPVLFGTFFRKVPLHVPVAASVVAIAVHFGVYYGRLTPYMQLEIRNPGIAAALAIMASVSVAGILMLAYQQKENKKLITDKQKSLTT